MESWPIQCTRILLSWNHDRPWIDPRQCNYWNQKGNNNKSDCGAFALTAAFLICSKVSLCKQYTYMVTLTLLQVDTPYNLIDNYMDGNSTSKLPPPMLSQSQLILVFWRNNEGLSLRVQLLNKVFQGQDSSDLIRQIELACAKYTRMISTLLGDSAGLAIGDSDMLTMLVRSLHNDVRNYCLMHSSGESYSSYRLAARRFEQQHRLFKDLNLQSRKVVAGFRWSRKKKVRNPNVLGILL